MKPSRRAQPYRTNTPNMPGQALNAMRRGRTTGGWNPKDVERVKMLTQARGRPKRRQRPGRPQRPPR